MKKIFGVLLVILFTIPVMLMNVFAAVLPYAWTAGGTMVDGSDSSIRVEKSSDSVTLYLKNYSGGKLNLECYGTAQNEITFNIVLEGENIVNADDIGIDFSYDGKINFSGNGNLTINASKPISYENYEKQMYISPSENIYKQGKDSVQSSSTDSQTTGEIIENDNDDEMPVEGMVKEPSNYNSNDLIYSIICIYIVVSLTLIIFLIIKVKKLQKNNK